MNTRTVNQSSPWPRISTGRNHLADGRFYLHDVGVLPPEVIALVDAALAAVDGWIDQQQGKEPT